MKHAYMTAVLMALALAACKDKPPAGPVAVKTAPRIAAPTTAEGAAEAQADLLRGLEPLPALKDPKTIVAPDGETWTRYDNGIMIQEIKIGIEGMPPRPGQTVSVAYVGTFPGSNKEFDRKEAGDPKTFRYCSTDEIKGLNYGVSTMHVMGKRRVFVPPELGYGERGTPDKIGPNQALIFQIELLSVQGQAVEFPLDMGPTGIMGPPATDPGVPASGPASAPASMPGKSQ